MKSLEKFDSAFTLAAPPLGRAAVFNGFFTITFPGGEHRTFRVHSKKLTAKFAPGERILSILIGPENEKDYQPFAFIDDRGIRLWKKARAGQMQRYSEIFWTLATGGTLEGHQILESRRCLICNRPLITPESIETGVGPSCREK